MYEINTATKREIRKEEIGFMGGEKYKTREDECENDRRAERGRIQKDRERKKGNKGAGGGGGG